MRKLKTLLAIVLALALLFSIAACGGKDKKDDTKSKASEEDEEEDDPSLGLYVGISIDMSGDGDWSDISDLYEEETSLELKSNGKGTLIIDGSSMRITWKLSRSKITVEAEGEEYSGTLEDGVIVLDFMSFLFKFAKDGADVGSVKSSNKSDSKSEKAFLGEWVAVAVDYGDGDLVSLDDLPEDSRSTIEILAGGKGTFMSLDLEWSVDYGTITLKNAAEEMYGTIEDGFLVIGDFAGLEGVTYYFSKDGSMPEIESGSASGLTAAQEMWNGTWYGYMWIGDAYGEYSDWENDMYDAYMVLQIEDDDTGNLSIFIEDDEEAIVGAYITANEYYLEMTEGMFWDMDLDPIDWYGGLSPSIDGKFIVFTSIYVDPTLTDNDYFEYSFHFRPYGETWDGSEGKLPPGYDDYLQALGGGASDPYGNNKPSGDPAPASTAPSGGGGLQQGEEDVNIYKGVGAGIGPVGSVEPTLAMLKEVYKRWDAYTDKFDKSLHISYADVAGIMGCHGDFSESFYDGKYSAYDYENSDRSVVASYTFHVDDNGDWWLSSVSTIPNSDAVRES